MTRWGVVALASMGLAVIAANISALVPATALSGLHATRFGGVSVEELRADLASLRQETAELRRENGELVARFSLSERAGTAATRRIGALEASLPHLLEALSAGPAVDRTTTASIGTPADELIDAEGGAMRVVRTPLFASTADDQPMPAPVETAAFTPNGEGRFGIAVGPSITPAQVGATWDDLARTLGPTILGLAPLVADEMGGGKRIVLGPAADLAEATTLCGRLERASVSCQPMPYTGTPLVP
ncbi:hypothetical protein VE25_05305 [Devosia geojensis]|uniref:SPOR domain-containing protein n=1 Tax=Devosia geojensis TaxID=443610 RepID=A0A0F5FW16_9HYPH|nr:hypothetical protein [Devosia geojensis]KKB12765.1 hypothetical protein VE25_05305 [Devosia geojensis]